MYKNWRDLIRPKKLQVEAESYTNTYGKFYAEPFERGFGTTLGNSLRRVILSSLQGAARLGSQRSSEARDAVEQATEALQKFRDSLNSQLTAQQLAQAYQLKQMLDQQARTFDARSKPGSSISEEQLQRAIDAARQTLDQLKKSAEQEPTRNAFGQPLRDALDDPHRAALDSLLQRLQQAQDEAGKQQRAREARDGLADVGRAFNRSQPQSLQSAQQSDALQPGGQDSFNLGVAELDSLVKQMEQKRQVSPEDLAKQERDALYYLQHGLRELRSDNNSTSIAVARLEKLLRNEQPPDLTELKKLLDELQHFSAESADQLASRQDKPDLTNIDPSRLPPAYRGRIQKYFQKLSEK